MGAVWLARNAVLDVDVAIKLDPAQRGTAEAASASCKRRAPRRSIGHPQSFASSTSARPSSAIPSSSWRCSTAIRSATVLHAQGRLAADEAVRTLLPVASALAAAHAKGIVHRDLKPDNVVLVADGRKRTPKVVDFGIAKLRVDDVERHVTQAGTVLGSPDYMSPEQALGKTDVDERVDIWALAVMLYERSPARALLGAQLQRAHRRDHPRTRRRRSPTAAGDEALCGASSSAASRRTRDARWPSMRRFGMALAEWAIAQGVDTDVAGTSLEAHWLDDGAAPALGPAAAGLGSVPAPLLALRALPVDARGLPAAWSATGERPARDSGAGPSAASREPPGAAPAPRQDASPAPPPRPRRALAGVAAVVLVAAAGGLFAARGLHPRRAPAPSAHAEAAPLPASAPAPPAESERRRDAHRARGIHDRGGDRPHGGAPRRRDVAPGAARARRLGRVRDLAVLAPACSRALRRSIRSSSAPKTDPRRGATALRSRVVLASADGRPTDAMREWALLSWYEMAAFAVVRGRCCAASPPLEAAAADRELQAALQGPRRARRGRRRPGRRGGGPRRRAKGRAVYGAEQGRRQLRLQGQAARRGGERAAQDPGAEAAGERHFTMTETGPK